MSSDLHPHTAELRHSQKGDAWRVSWLPGRTVGRNEAITAVVMAEDVSAIKDLGPGHRHWPFIEGWSAELGLTPEQAWQDHQASGDRAGGMTVGEQLTHGDVMEIIEALREHAKRLRRMAARRDAIGPRNKDYRAGLRARALQAERAADIVLRNGPEIYGSRH